MAVITRASRSRSWSLLRAAGQVGAVVGSMIGGGRAIAAPVSPAAEVVLLDDEVRLRRADDAAARAGGRILPAGGAEVVLVGLRGETLAFQLAVLAGNAPIERTALALSELADGAGARLPAAIFREHYLPVRGRSANQHHPAESLGWSAGARPPDALMLGDVPDALLPIELDASPVMSGPAVPARESGTFWVDVEVPASAAPGEYRGTGEVRGDGAALARFDVRVTVLPPLLPYRATSVFVYYEAGRLGARLGARAPAERQLWRLMHAHQIDALATLTSAADVDRLAQVYDGSLFAPGGPDGYHYQGPGAGLPPAVVALGAYGALGDPTPGSLQRVDEMLARLPAALGDVFLYAIDENCRSPRAFDWRRALAGRPAGRRVQVGQTCSEPPGRQPVDVALISAAAFERGTPAAARAAGRRAWIYGGALPQTGTLLLDADPRGLTANGWIAAAMGIERWFYWESTFWDDDNRGGRGPVDPFTTAVTFHNTDGDEALGDGVLLYPGRQQGRFAARSLGYEGLLPSLRLKALRRGVDDAGLIALAAREHPEATARIVAQALPAALDEARPDRPASWESAPLRFTAARAALRGLISLPAPMAAAEVRAAFDDLAARRRRTIPLAPSGGRLRLRHIGVVIGLLGMGAMVLLVSLLVIAGRRRRASRR